MKKMALLALGITFVVAGCVASKTKYIEIKTPTKLYMRGEVVATTQPGDTLKVISSKTCRSGKGACWKVKNERDSTGGIVRASEMELVNRVYEVENQ